MNDPAALLRRHRLHVTAQRIAVLRAVASRPHATADAIAEAVRGEIGSISRQSVYDALALLVEKGFIRRIQPIGSPSLYENRVDDNHHHLICRACSRVVDIDCAVGARPCLTASDDHGFSIDEAEVVYWGVCPPCAKAAPAESPIHPPTRRGRSSRSAAARPSASPRNAARSTASTAGATKPASTRRRTDHGRRK